MANPSANTSTPVPKMVVFGLDYTLWPFLLDTHMYLPFHKTEDGKVFDSRDRIVKYYPDMPKVLKYLHDKNIRMGVASRCEEREGAVELIRLLDWMKYFQNIQIYRRNKETHIKRISKSSHISLKEMIFFDDSEGSVNDVGLLGVVSILVKNGMTMPVLMNGLEQFSDLRSNV